MKLITVSLLLITSVIALYSDTISVNLDLIPRVTVESDTLGASSYFESLNSFFVYSNSDRSVIKLSKEGQIQSRIKCETIGRNGYIGDNFVVLGSNLYFLNSVDKKVEVFALNTGKHIKSISIKDMFTGGSFLDRMIIDIKVIDGSIIVVGNSKSYYLKSREEFDIKKVRALDKSKSNFVGLTPNSITIVK